VTRYLLLLECGLAALLLASCASSSIQVPKTVQVQVPVPCVDQAKRPPAPRIRTRAELMLLDRGTRTLAAWSDRLKMEQYVLELAAIVEGCSRIPPAAR
jgi:hypothetical protein